MEVGLLYSGGKDSTLAALLLEDFCAVTCLTCTFGVTDDYEHAQRAAAAVGLPAQRVDLDADIAQKAADRIVEDGFPRNGIQMVHEHALRQCAQQPFDAVADGTRRDDRVPTVERPLAQSIEDSHGVSHLAPLSGFGRDAIDALVADHFSVETGPSETVPKGDYETELRTLIADQYDGNTVETVFPDHEQSRVTGRQ